MNAEGEEELRLRKLRQYDILDTQREEAFDRITRLVSALLDVPIAAVTLVDRDRQWFKSELGLGIDETPREQSFCAHAMAGQGPMVVRDATLDPRFFANPLVTGHLGIRFYAGIPLHAADGTPLGALCAIDSRPRSIEPEQLAMLGDLANLTMEHLELRRMATLDGLTGAMRRQPFLASVARDMAVARQSGTPLCCLMIDIDHFKMLNDRFGHAFGDTVLIAIVARIGEQLRQTDSMGRMGGEEFCVFLLGTDMAGAVTAAERMRQAVEVMRFHAEPGEVRVTISMGTAQMHSGDISPSDLVKRADTKLYEAKNSGRNCVAA